MPGSSKTDDIPRRTALTAVAAAALLSGLPPQPAMAEDAVARLVRLATDKNDAFVRGEMERWAAMVTFTPDFTLMQPFGGPASHGFDASPERLARMSREFREGKATLEVAQTYASRELVVLVMIERQTGIVGGLPEQDWSLRVTEVYRKVGAEWQLAHRHADPLVRRISLGQTAALARGDDVAR